MQSLPVSRKLPEGEAKNGMEYLSQVRHEASKLPEWSFIPQINRTRIEESEEVRSSTLPNAIRPSAGWISRRLELYQRYHEIPFKNLTRKDILQELGGKIKDVKRTFFLLSKLEVLLEASEVSRVRTLGKKLVSRRSELLFKDGRIPDTFDSIEDQEQFVGLTYCILIVSTIFGQKDLGDIQRLDK